MGRLTEYQEKALAELRERHPDRPAYIHPILGVPVVGPTADEKAEVAQALDQEEKLEVDRYRDPATALEFLRECNGEQAGGVADPSDLCLGATLTSLDEVVAIRVELKIRSAKTEVVARVTTNDGRRLLVHACAAQYSGGFYEPPDYEAVLTETTEEQAAALRAAWGAS